MTINNTVNATLIIGTTDNDSILNFGDDVTIDSRSGNDTIYSGLDDQKADRVSINAGEGDNVVSIQGGSDSVTIRTGDGNNLIGSTSPNNAVFSGAGNDSVVFYTGADNNTIETGDGDDVIDAVGHNVTIDAGAGNDLINGFDANDTLRIVGHAVSDSIISEDNLIFDFGDGSLTLLGVSSTESLNVEYPANGQRFQVAVGNIIPLSTEICSAINATIKPRNFQSAVAT